MNLNQFISRMESLSTISIDKGSNITIAVSMYGPELIKYSMNKKDVHSLVIKSPLSQIANPDPSFIYAIKKNPQIGEKISSLDKDTDIFKFCIDKDLFGQIIRDIIEYYEKEGTEVVICTRYLLDYGLEFCINEINLHNHNVVLLNDMPEEFSHEVSRYYNEGIYLEDSMSKELDNLEIFHNYLGSSKMSGGSICKV